MKRLSLLLISVLIFTTSYSGEVTKTYSFGNYKIEKAGEYQLIRFDNSLNTGFTGEPSLPWFAVKLLLPPGEKAVSFTVSGQNEISLQEINLKLRLIEGGFVEHMDNEFQKHKKKVKEENVVNYHG